MAGREQRLHEAVSEAVRACAEYAAVGDALGYSGERGRERLLDAVVELSRWLRDAEKAGRPEGSAKVGK